MIAAEKAAADVVAELFVAMSNVVMSYDDGAVRVDGFIDGTAFFPGGAGLWRARQPRGPLPRAFPHRPVMILGHNFDSVRGHQASVARGIERLNSGTWKYLLAYLEAAAIPSEECFFTNALVGLQPKGANGPMRAGEAYLAECRRFLTRQIEIVEPQLIAVLGVPALEHVLAVDPAVPVVALLHPGALTYVKAVDRAAFIEREAAKLRSALPRADVEER